VDGDNYVMRSFAVSTLRVTLLPHGEKIRENEIDGTNGAWRKLQMCTKF
jgi:hypothetical protein